MHRTTLSIGALSAAALAAHAGGPVSWSQPGDGIWGSAANWDPAVIPGASDDVLLGLAGPYTVSVANANRAASSLTITNPDATLNVNGFRILTLFGDVLNQGLMVVNPTSIGSGTRLLFESDAAITGSGTIRLNSSGTTAELAAALGVEVTQWPGHTIAGFGRITGTLVNHGLVEADVANQTLGLYTNDKANNARMNAINGATLEINGVNLLQGITGEVVADGAGSEIRLVNAGVTGGLLAGENGGSVVVAANSTMHGVELQGSARVDGFRTLTILGSLENNAALTVNPTAIGSATSILFEGGAVLDGSGEIVLASNATTAEIRSNGGTNVMHGEDHTIRGRGRVSAALTNHGLISADVAGQTLEMTSQDKTNESEIRAINGSALDLQAFTLIQTPSASITADGPGSGVRLSGVGITGGVLRAEGGGLITVRANSSVADLTLEGPAVIEGFRFLDVAGTLVNNGLVTVNPTQIGAGTGVRFTDGAQLIGEGRVVLDANSTTALLSTAEGEGVTQGPDHTIAGRGRISAMLTNNGLIEADQPGHAMELQGQNKVNNAEMRAVNGAVLSVLNTTIAQPPGGRLAALGPGSVLDLSSTTIQGGSIQTKDGGLVRLQSSNATASGVAMDATIEVMAYRSLTVDNGATNDGSITVNPTGVGPGTSLRFASGFTLEGDGLIRLAANSTTAAIAAAPGVTNAALGSGQRLEGIGAIQTPLAIHGAVAPGLDGVGTLNAGSPVTLSATSVFEAEVSDNQVSDRIASTSTFHADGTLDVSFVDGFNPLLYWSAPVVTANQGVTGRFSTATGPQPSHPDLEFRVRYLPNAVHVGAYCKADFAEPFGVADIFDLLAFIDTYTNAGPDADLVAPLGSVDIFDLLEYITRYNAGCP